MSVVSCGNAASLEGGFQSSLLRRVSSKELFGRIENNSLSNRLASQLLIHHIPTIHNTSLGMSHPKCFGSRVVPRMPFIFRSAAAQAKIERRCRNLKNVRPLFNPQRIAFVARGRQKECTA